MSILDVIKILMYEFCYDYVKPKYQDKAKLCYMDTDSFFIHIKTEDLQMNLEERLWKNLLHLEQKTYAYLLDDNSEHKKAKGTKKCNKKKIYVWKLYRLLV